MTAESRHSATGAAILGDMRSPLAMFAGLLDRSIQEIAALAADARTFDISRIGRIADIWDNNTFPLVSAACAPRLLRAGRARAGLRWMADLGPDRRELMIDLEPAVDVVLPAAGPELSAYRDYQGRVRPGSFPVTAELVAALTTDYDLAGASVRSLAMRPAETGRQAKITLAAPRRFVPGSGRLAPDGARRPWPPAPLIFTLRNVDDLSFDVGDRIGFSVTLADSGPVVSIGHGGHLRAASASVWPQDPRWHESAAGRAADAVTPPVRRARRKPGRHCRGRAGHRHHGTMASRQRRDQPTGAVPDHHGRP